MRYRRLDRARSRESSRLNRTRTAVIDRSSFFLLLTKKKLNSPRAQSQKSPKNQLVLHPSDIHVFFSQKALGWHILENSVCCHLLPLTKF